MAEAIFNALEEQWTDDHEWTIDITSSEVQIESIESILMSMPDLEAVTRPERIEVFLEGGEFHGWTVNIEGAERIRTYCETGHPWLVPATWTLTHVKDARVLPNVYVVAMRTYVSRTYSEPAQNIARTWWTSVPKTHRLIKTFEHKHLRTGIVYEVVLDKLMAEGANLQDALRGEANSVQTRVRARWSRGNANARGQNGQAQGQGRTFYQHGMRLAAMTRNEPTAMRLSVHEAALVSFGKLLMGARRRPRPGQPRDERPFFMAPKPVTLEQVHLIDPDARYGAVTILDDYCVTDKADGERMLMYVNGSGEVFLINNSLEVRHTGIVARSASLHESVIDGEFIDASLMRFPGQKSTFAAFDVYFRNGQSVINRPLMGDAGSRYEILKDMFDDLGHWNWNGANIAVRVKVHRRASGLAIFDAVRATLADIEKLPYANDGLVFTPASLYVWGVYANKRPVSVAPEMTRWDRVFKWKPAHLNSVDFLVQATEARRGNVAAFDLMCGYNMVKNSPIEVQDGLRYLHDSVARAQMQTLRERYEPAPFEPHTYIKEDAHRMWVAPGADGVFRTHEGQPLVDDCIVECDYDLENDAWRPMRLREDKTRLFKVSRNISRAANDMSTARNIWMTIHEPVTMEMITGAVRVQMSEIEARATTEERYYARDIARYHLLSVNMQNFHNLIIKKQLFEYPPVSFRRRLLELACGQAGDLSRWTDAGYSVVVGIDKNNNNITDPMNGAYARAMRMSGDNNVPKMAFMVGDCGKLLSNGDAFVDADDSKGVWQSLNRGNPPDYLAPVAAAFRPSSSSASASSSSHAPHSRTPMFDAVSCQFAIHYFFESAETLDAFLKNVAKHLVEGGYFMCSFMDGAQVDVKLRATGGGVLTGRVANTVIWAIHKNYETLDVPSDDIYGKKIGVYLENTRQLITEYIVPFQALVEKAEAAGLVLKESETFASTFERESKNHAKGDPLHGIFEKFKREGVQRGFSNLNRWAVFRRGG